MWKLNRKNKIKRVLKQKKSIKAEEIIKKLEQKIEELYIDQFFEIYTRTGFEEKIQKLRKAN